MVETYRATSIFPQTKVERESRGLTMVASVLTELLSRNLFPTGFLKLPCRT
jgi:hypothetical protein